MFIRESNSLYVFKFWSIQQLPAMAVRQCFKYGQARSNQTPHFQDGRPRLISPVQYLTKCEISSQSYILFLNYGIGKSGDS